MVWLCSGYIYACTYTYTIEFDGYIYIGFTFPTIETSRQFCEKKVAFFLF